MLQPSFFAGKFKAGLSYDEYVSGGRPDQRENWGRVHARVKLADAQQSLLASFTRRMIVFVSTGLWCGDCAHQVPILDHLARAAGKAPDGDDRIVLRCFDRDAHPDLSEPLRICGGLRVPTVVWLNEDFEFVHLLGDRTLSRYRAMALRNLGDACPLPGAAPESDELAATTADWVDEFERVHLVLRLSPKLRDRYAD